MASENPWEPLKRSLADLWSSASRSAMGKLRGLFERPKPSAWTKLAKAELAQVKLENDFYLHLAAFVPGVLLIGAANLASLPLLPLVPSELVVIGGSSWGIVACALWGAGLLIHGVDTFGSKRPTHERKRRKLEEALLREPVAAAAPPPAGPSFSEMRERIIVTAEHARQSLRQSSPEVASVVTRGEAGALSALAWLESALGESRQGDRDLEVRRRVASSLADPAHPGPKGDLVALMSDLDRRAQLLDDLRRQSDERRTRVDSFLLALEGAKVARPESLPAVTRPLRDRVALLEAPPGPERPSASPGAPAQAPREGRVADEIKMARELQRTIMPAQAPPVPGLEVAHVYRPCHEVGGDFYDFYATSPGKLLVALGDASGHGIDSSMISSMCKSALYLQVAARRPLPEALAEINRMMCDTLGRRRLMSLALVEIDTTRGLLTYVNAGQLYPLVRRRERVQEVELPGYPLGVRRDVVYAVRETRLHPGDVVLLATDGLVEAVAGNGDAYGYGRLSSALLASGSGAPEDVVDRLAADLSAHLGEVAPQDDVTIVAVKVT